MDRCELLSPTVPLLAQPTGQGTNALVPTLVSFSGKLTDVDGRPPMGIVGVTFYLYKDAEGSTPLMDGDKTQNVTPDKDGRYAVMLGASTSAGLPTDLFASGEARWLGVQAQGQPEQPRVLLLSVPYALKAADAETLGGKPASAFLQAVQADFPGSPDTSRTNSGEANTKAQTAGLNTITAGNIPMFTNSSGGLTNSTMFQSTTANIGMGTASPAAKLHVIGNIFSTGHISSLTNAAYAVRGDTSDASGSGVIGQNLSTKGGTGVSGSGETAGVAGNGGATGVFGQGFLFGVEGKSFGSIGSGVKGISQPASSWSSLPGVVGYGGTPRTSPGSTAPATAVSACWARATETTPFTGKATP